ncbi:Rieske (2Fe-2S) protein [Gramella sp. MT6]|uniref:QcrA and Rieske domain-containing protein n=1 Tax=Gramella sp. MT6 TaxID=2705471 RepID=UPI001C6045E9|nr:Rieske (2Fe-2S) protein [Gramella sp. MT6]QYA24464.1 Rieske (2Fe-2S) protein [Gramella sp. MT6]
MKRGEFLVKGVLLACSGACALSACSSGDDGGGGTPNPPGNGGGPTAVSVNLSNLAEIGDQVTSGGVLFFRIGEGNTSADFVATEAVCPHQGGQLVWVEEEGYIECQLHFSRYEEDGDVIRGPQNEPGSTRDLEVYSTTISSTTITATVS